MDIHKSIHKSQAGAARYPDEGTPTCSGSRFADMFFAIASDMNQRYGATIPKELENQKGKDDGRLRR